jgi:signal transduction histidine kinase/DNA-binding NarL/FixJ family response regulator
MFSLKKKVLLLIFSICFIFTVINISIGAFLGRGILSICAVMTVLSFFAAIFAAETIAKVRAKDRELLIEAERASEAKSAFLASMSHEMRTNLNAIIGLTELELENHVGLRKSTEMSLEKVHSAGVSMLGVTNDILDISKIESGRLEFVPVEYNLASLISDTVALNVVRIGSKPVKFVLDINEDLPAKLYGDELRIKQMFNNLLSNAVKYTHSGVITLSVRCEKDETNGQSEWLVCKVTDTGIGIKKEDLEKLFVVYSQIDRGNNRKIEGTGLGLAITKELADKMGGSVDVESQYGMGSTFMFKVRQGFVSKDTIGRITAEKLKANEYISGRRAINISINRAYIPYARVLAVDDMDGNLEVIRGMMRPYGITVDCVNSGQGAIDLVKNGKIKYNAIFMDYIMPQMDGLETTRIIRNEIGTEYARTVPIIALTADAAAGSAEMFLQNGFQGLLSKPINMKEMNSIINTFVRDWEYEAEEERKTKVLRNTSQTTRSSLFTVPA